MAQIVRLDDLDDPRLRDYTDLRDVQLRLRLESERGLFLAEGEKVVRRAVESGHRPRSFLMSPRWLEGLADVLDSTDAPCFVLDDASIERLTGFHVHRGSLAALERPDLPSPRQVLDAARRVVVVEDLADHTNVGSLSTRGVSSIIRVAVFEDFVDHANVGAAFRAAAALGIDAVLLSPRCADPLYRRAIKTSMGAVFQIPYARFADWPEGIEVIRDSGFFVAGMALSDDSISLSTLVDANHEKLALVFGTEGSGLWRRTLDAVDATVKIPMHGGIDSLNVASSAAIAFYATQG
ncbi:TrmH family RNA methyltransferase [Aeromicrobium endophyticum]|uniref:RNA methyltransferase n=1 Tax=Aeromicrobium endophyticum TaxID=2292704 RepID=A0A371P2Q0_9ACTN|nr:RNA methyltransferase [Aeromicrobium endophyticum]REK70222.1 RNA methyltransferase [Aeromicrobium endophyticum]